MIHVSPIKKALVPTSSAVATRLSSPNYDEFQGDAEIWEFIKKNPDTILKIKMPHCDVPSIEEALVEGSPEALAHAAKRMAALQENSEMRVMEQLLYVYEIETQLRPVRQIGLGCFADTKDILTENTPSGVIIRNEGIRESKMLGRAELIKATRSFVGVVNNAVEDKNGQILTALTAHARAQEPSHVVHDERGNTHRVWLVTDPRQQQRFVQLFAAEPFAYVADGNHRSAAAAMLGYEHFMTVFFPARTMGICPYNRLVQGGTLPLSALLDQLQQHFEVNGLGKVPPYQPERTHDIGFYTDGRWFRLVPKPGSYDAANAVDCLDADIVQRHFFEACLGIADARDERLTFVGSNKDARYLQEQIDNGRYKYALTLPPVTMDQFIMVCRQRRMMPPKSTWFEPKIRSGLVVALL